MIHCPLCRVRFRLPLGFKGRTIGCPGCWKVLDVTNLTNEKPPAWRKILLATLLSWLDSWRRPPDPARSAGFIETRQWAWDYNPSPLREVYELALEFAEKRYEEMRNLSETLDKKLDDVARTSLAIGVLIATAARVLGADSSLGRSSLLIPAVIVFAVSVLVAVLSRSPTASGTPLEIRGLLKVIDDDKELTRSQTQAVLASSYHVAVVATSSIDKWKARQLWRATFFLLVGIALLIAVLVTGRLSARDSSEKQAPEKRNQTETDATPETRSRKSVAPSR